MSDFQKENKPKIIIIAESLFYQIATLTVSFLIGCLFIVPEYSYSIIGYLSENKGIVYSHNVYGCECLDRIENDLQFLLFFCLYLPLYLYVIILHLNFSLFKNTNLKVWFIFHYIVLYLSFYFDTSKSFLYNTLLDQDNSFSENIILNSNIEDVVFVFMYYQFIILYCLPLLYLNRKLNHLRWLLICFTIIFLNNISFLFFLFCELTAFFLFVFKRWLSG